MVEEGADDIVTAICDFMMQQKSPNALNEPDPRVEMGGSYSKPKFERLVRLASWLVRCQYTSTYTEDQKTFIRAYDGEKDEELDEKLVRKQMNIP